MLSLELQPRRPASRPSSALNVRDGHLCVEGIDVVALAQSVEAPFVLVSRRQIADNLAFVCDAFRARHTRTSLVYRAGLPLSPRLCGLLRETQVRVEVASPEELGLARAHGLAVSRIVVRAESGREAVAAALEAGVDAVGVSCVEDATLVADVAARRNTTARCMLRLDSELAGGWWARQSAPLPGAFEQIRARLAQVETTPSLTLVGLAADLGPQVCEVEAYEQVTQLLGGLADELAPTQRAALEFLELGGGMVGEEVVAADSQGRPLGAVAGVARVTCYDDYAQAVTAAATLGGLELRIAPGNDLLAGAVTLVARLVAHDGNHAIAPDRSLTLAGDGWLLPAGTDRLWHAPTVAANRADEPHAALHWVDLPMRSASSGGAQRHVLRRSLPATTAADDLVAFLNWGPTEGGSVAGGSGDTEPTALLVDGETLGLLGPQPSLCQATIGSRLARGSTRDDR